jgi:hypothetical protein
VEDCGATVPAIQHMVSMARHLSSWNPRHRSRTVCHTGVGRQEKVACPLFLSLNPFSLYSQPESLQPICLSAWNPRHRSARCAKREAKGKKK